MQKNCIETQYSDICKMHSLPLLKKDDKNIVLILNIGICF